MAGPGLYVGQIVTVVLADVFSNEDFERFMDDLFRAVAPGDRFILGFGDNVPTDALFPRIKRAAQIWAERGRYPLQSQVFRSNPKCIPTRRLSAPTAAFTTWDCA